MREIERAAGRCFVDVGMPEIADDPPPPAGELDRYRQAGLAWVAVGPTDLPVAYLVAEHVDGGLHVDRWPRVCMPRDLSAGIRPGVSR